MGKKKGLAAIFSKPNKPADGAPSPPWPWPSCANNPQTASFRRNGASDDDRPCTTAGRSPTAAAGRLVPPRKAAGDMYKTVNSVYLDPADSARFSSFDDGEDDGVGGDEEEFDEALDDVVSYSTTTASEEWSEAVIRSLGRRTCTDRFFFDSGPPPASNSIHAASRSPSPSPSSKAVPEAAVVMPDDRREGDFDVEEFEEESEEEPRLPSTTSPVVEESVAVALDSEDPYGDFRASMEEMVSAHGLRDWASLQEMLLCYLRINAKHNHALILGAFVDLLVGLASATIGGGSRSGVATTTTTTTTTTAITATETSSSSSSTSSVAGDGATCSSTAATIAEEEQWGSDVGSGGTGASCSPAAASSDQEDDVEPPVGKKAASGDE